MRRTVVLLLFLTFSFSFSKSLDSGRKSHFQNREDAPYSNNIPFVTHSFTLDFLILNVSSSSLHKDSNLIILLQSGDFNYKLVHQLSEEVSFFELQRGTWNTKSSNHIIVQKDEKWIVYWIPQQTIRIQDGYIEIIARIKDDSDMTHRNTKRMDNDIRTEEGEQSGLPYLTIFSISAVMSLMMMQKIKGLFKSKMDPTLNLPNKITWHLIKDASIAFDQNPQWRKSMEDDHAMVDRLGGETQHSYFAIYDGHGGSQTAEYLTKHLHNNLWKCLSTIEDEKEAFKEAYCQTDKDLLDEKIGAGSTAVSVLIRAKQDGKWLYTANCGDSRAVLVREGKAIRLSYDHKPSDDKEKARIESLDGFVSGGKLAGALGVSRSFGDASFKKWVEATPDTSAYLLTGNDTHIILACDGLWDVVTDQEAADLIVTESDAQRMSTKLLDYALANESKDNISIIVIVL